MSRAYSSPLRAEQAQRTREKILDALTDQLVLGAEEFSIDKVAEAAGVSVRTVYHHFPNRDAQVEAVAHWLERRLGPADPPPRALSQVPAFAEHLIRRAVSSPRDLRAHVAPGIARQVRAKRRGERDKAIAALVPDRRAAAALGAVIGAELGLALLDRYKLEGEELIATHAWIVQVVVDAIARGDAPSASPRRSRRP